MPVSLLHTGVWPCSLVLVLVCLEIRGFPETEFTVLKPKKIPAPWTCWSSVLSPASCPQPQASPGIPSPWPQPTWGCDHKVFTCPASPSLSAKPHLLMSTHRGNKFLSQQTLSDAPLSRLCLTPSYPPQIDLENPNTPPAPPQARGSDRRKVVEWLSGGVMAILPQLREQTVQGPH